MNDELTIKDLLLFIKQKKKIIISTALIVIIAITAYIFISYPMDDDTTETQTENEETTEEVQEILEIPQEERTKQEKKILEDALYDDYFYFRVYIEREDERTFKNKKLLKEILLNDETIKAVEERVDIPEEDYLEDFIHVEIDDDSDIYTIVLATGQYEFNKELSEAYYDVLTNEDVGVLTNKTLYFFDEPMEEEKTDDADDMEIKKENTGPSTSNIIVIFVVSLFFSFLFGILVAVIYSLISKRISIIYNFRLNKNDKFINLTRVSDSSNFTEMLLMSIDISDSKHQNILYESETITDDLLDTINLSTEKVEKHEELVNTDYKNLNEVIIVVNIEKTTKYWYEKQHALIKGTNIPLTLVLIEK